MKKLILPLIVFLVGVNCQDAVKAPVQSTPIETLTNPVPAIESNPTPATTALNAPAGTPITASQPIEGTTTEHRSPDGSIITITKFNGNLPASFVQPYTQGGFNPFYQPYYNPFFWPYGQMQMNGQQPQPGAPPAAPQPPAASEKRSRRATKVVEQEKAAVAPSYISTLPKRPRHHPAFHFPATVEDYWKMHKRPEVPITENLVK